MSIAGICPTQNSGSHSVSYSGVCTNKWVQYTLLVIGILAIVLAQYYLTGIAKTLTTCAGGLAIAYFVINRYCCCYWSTNPLPLPPLPSANSLPISPSGAHFSQIQPRLDVTPFAHNPFPPVFHMPPSLPSFSAIPTDLNPRLDLTPAAIAYSAPSAPPASHHVEPSAPPISAIPTDLTVHRREGESDKSQASLIKIENFARSGEAVIQGRISILENRSRITLPNIDEALGRDSLGRAIRNGLNISQRGISRCEGKERVFIINFSNKEEPGNSALQVLLIPEGKPTINWHIISNSYESQETLKKTNCTTIDDFVSIIEGTHTSLELA